MPLHIPGTKVVMYSNASFNNTSDGRSQGGYLVFLADKKQHFMSHSWRSNKLRWVARYTLTAETLAFTD